MTNIKSYMPVLLLLMALAVTASGCTGNDGWSFTVNGDASKTVNATLYGELKNSTTEVDGVTGIPLELFLYYYGIYPVAGVSYGGKDYNWTAVVEGADKDAYVLVEPNGSIYYDGKAARVDNINITVAEKPALSTLDVAPSVLYALGAGGREGLAHKKVNRTVIFYVDALGYDRYEDALSQGLAKNMSSLGEPLKAVCVYPSVTQNNAKAMVTGAGPNLTMGDFRSYIARNDTMFDVLERRGLRAVWVGGTTAPVKLNNTSLNVDKNGDGSSDDDAADAAVKEYRGGASLVVVHFKDTDTMMHNYGPYSPEGRSSVARTDALVGRVLQYLDNDTLAIVWADHGCHPVPGGGNHGTLAPEDMYVPIIAGTP